MPESSDSIIAVYTYLVAISLYIANICALYRIGKKAGLDNLWCAFVPFLQFILFFHIIKRSAWWALILLIPVVDVVASLFFYWEFYSAFGIDTIWKLLAIIFPFPIGTVLLFYMAFSDITYKLGYNRYMKNYS
jgi:hypothetical protein